MTDCYVVSVHHTMREDRYITIWRIDDTACILTGRPLYKPSTCGD